MGECVSHPLFAVHSFKYMQTRPQRQNSGRNWSCLPCSAVIRLMLQRGESGPTTWHEGLEKEPSSFPNPPHSDSRQHLPFFRAWAMTSAALLLITLVMYRGQLVWLAMVIERFTASASTYGRASECENCPHSHLYHPLHRKG